MVLDVGDVEEEEDVGEEVDSYYTQPRQLKN